MHYILDFDYTLFDTHRMRVLLSVALSVSEEKFCAAEQEITRSGALYTPAAHMLLLDRSLDDFEKALVEIAPQCVYADARDFLSSVIETPLTVLTFGNVAWQEQKIAAAQLGNAVSNVVATNMAKEEVICQWKNERDIIIVNDRGSEIDRMAAVFPGAIYVLMQRAGTPYVQEVCAAADRRVDSFIHLQ